MEPIIIAHIVLGSLLTLCIIFTVYFLIRMLLANSQQKALFTTRLRQSGTATVVLFVVYMGWVFIKKTLL